MADKEYIVQRESLESIADEIRVLSGATELLGLDEMAENINDANEEVVGQTNLIAQLASALQGKSVPGGSEGGEGTETYSIQESKSVTPSTIIQTVKPDAGYDGLASVTVAAMPTGAVGTPSITLDDTGLITATATVNAGYVNGNDKTSTKQLTIQEAKTITPSTSSQTAVAAGVYTTGAVKVAAIPTVTRADTTLTGTADDSKDTITYTASNNQGTGYVTGSNKTATKTVALTTSGATVTASDGSVSVSKSVSTATQATPSVSIDSSTGLVSASASQSAGYVSAGTKTGTLQLSTQAAKTVTPSTSEQTVVTAGKYTTGAVKVAAMPAGSVGNPSISVSDSGLISATASVNAGYVDGTDKSGTKQLTVKAATTITPGTSNQTIAAGTYLTGAQTIVGDADLVPENIADGVTIFGVTGTHGQAVQEELPPYVYTGSASNIDEGSIGWQIEFLDSGTLLLSEDRAVDIFVVGGGGSGGSSGHALAAGGSGGGGGYTATVRNVELKAGIYYNVAVGAGGASNTSSTSYNSSVAGLEGGESSFADGSGNVYISAFGGKGGSAGGTNNSGGAGGSGGGGAGATNSITCGAGGSDGENGSTYGGTGQNTTTRAFGEDSGKLYAGGGGAAGSSGYQLAGAAGGEGGGGKGGASTSSNSVKGTAGTVNSGGGGGGGHYGGGYAGAGGSGIVIMRNARG